MQTANAQKITVETIVNAPVEKVWKYWSAPEHIVKWNQASEDWHSPKAENDLRTGGKFNVRMEAKDGSFGFDFGGDYNQVEEHKLIDYTMSDGRSVQVVFTPENDKTRVTETFDAEGTNSVELQRSGWQAIMDSFKKYTEEN